MTDQGMVIQDQRDMAAVLLNESSRRGMTGSELSDLADISKNTVWRLKRILRDETEAGLSLRSVLKMADVLGLQVEVYQKD